MCLLNESWTVFKGLFWPLTGVYQLDSGWQKQKSVFFFILCLYHSALLGRPPTSGRYDVIYSPAEGRITASPCGGISADLGSLKIHVF